MFAFVHRLRRQGQLIPRHQLTHHQGLVGLFTLKEERDREIMRTLPVARLKEHDTSSVELLPALLDAMVIYASPATWTVTGWEREEEGLYGRAYQQSWWLIPLKPHEVLEHTRAQATRLLTSQHHTVG